MRRCFTIICLDDKSLGPFTCHTLMLIMDVDHQIINVSNQSTRLAKTSVFLEFDDSGFPLLRHASLAVYASRLTKRFQLDWQLGDRDGQSNTLIPFFPFPSRANAASMLGIVIFLKYPTLVSSVKPMFHRRKKSSIVQFDRHPSVSIVRKDA